MHLQVVYGKDHNWLELETKGEQLDYFPHLKAVHLNDSVYPFGSRRDRHANIGAGHIGRENFQQYARLFLFEGNSDRS